MSGVRFRSALGASPDPVLIFNPTGIILFASNRIKTMLGYHPDELVGKPLSCVIPEAYKALHASHKDRFRDSTGPCTINLSVLRKGGSRFLAEISLGSDRAAGGLVMIAAIRDVRARTFSNGAMKIENSRLQNLLAKSELEVTEGDEAKHVQRLLLEETHHRIKNTLATIQGIVSLSLKSAKSLEEGADMVASRLEALGRAHDLLLQTDIAGAKLPEVIDGAIEPYESNDAERFVLQIIPVEIGSGAILPLTMSFNELCTNAVKYGALSNATGHVEISSFLNARDQRLKLIWAEKGGPVVQPPKGRGFGTRLLGGLAKQLHGDIQLRFEPSGAVYELNASLPDLQSLKAH